MKPKIRKRKRNVLLCAGSALLLAAPAFAAAHETRQLTAGEKATVTGAILSRDGDLIRIPTPSTRRRIESRAKDGRLPSPAISATKTSRYGASSCRLASAARSRSLVTAIHRTASSTGALTSRYL
jgi:hypothetical protein